MSDVEIEKCVPECAYREKVTELQAELNLAREIYPEQMKIVRDTSATVKELILHFAGLAAAIQKDIRDNPLYCIPRL